MTNINRRSFVQKAMAITTGTAAFGALAAPSALAAVHADKSLMVIGPAEGYTPQIGTLVSMMNYNRMTVIKAVQKLSVKELDYLFDKKANSIGALIMHLGAVDKFYQLNTFEGKQELGQEDEKVWGAAMELGDKGRNEIKGHNAKYYIDLITEVREQTLAAFKNKDDAWLLAIDPVWSKEENINTYWKWFHVCEHESNHRGQITWLKSRLPVAKESKE